MNHVRFLGLLCAVGLVLYGMYWALEHHIIAGAVTAKGVTLGFVKKLSTKAFWEHVPLVMGKWGLKSILKSILIQMPKTLIVACVLMFMGPPGRRWLRVQL